MLKENKALKSRIKKLEERVFQVELDTSRQDTYIRRNNIEIQGIPSAVTNLEETVISVVGKLDINVDLKDIEACHRLEKRRNSPKPVIVRFVNRKHCERIHKEKKRLKDISVGDIEGLHDNTNIFFNENLCPYYQKIFRLCYKLKKNGFIDSVWSFHGDVFYKLRGSDEKILVRDESELVESFPNFFRENSDDEI